MSLGRIDSNVCVAEKRQAGRTPNLLKLMYGRFPSQQRKHQPVELQRGFQPLLSSCRHIPKTSSKPIRVLLPHFLQCLMGTHEETFAKS